MADRTPTDSFSINFARIETDAARGADSFAFVPADEGRATADSKDDKWIDVLSIDWGVSQPAAGDQGFEPIKGGETLSLLLPAVQVAEDADAGFDLMF